MTVIEGLNWALDRLLPALFGQLDSFMIGEYVSLLGFSVGITVMVIVIGAIVLRV